jgi:hypothetical protein
VLAALIAAIVLVAFEQHVAEHALPAIIRLLMEAVLSYAVCGLALLCSPDGLRIATSIWRLRLMFMRIPNTL